MQATWLTPTPEVTKVQTDNGATAYSSTGMYVLDFFTDIGANQNVKEMATSFANALREDAVLATRALFYARDIRGGQGERKLFRELYKTLDIATQDKYLALVPEFGRWDDLFEIVPMTEYIRLTSFLKETLANDWDRLSSGLSISLAAKWMPSENASSPTTRARARALMESLGLQPKQYRKLLSTLRGSLNLVETSLTHKDYESIKVQLLPARAVKKYKVALKAHVPEQFAQVLKDVAEGVEGVKINTKSLYPYEVILEPDHALKNAQWAQIIKDKVYPVADALVVCDVSGSMGYYQHTVLQPIHVAMGLTMYFAETNSPAWSNQFITFSGNPVIQDLGVGSLSDKLARLSEAHWEMNTNIDKVFALILAKAKLGNLQAPNSIVIISDMQFDSCVKTDKTVFKKYRDKFAEAGLVLPNVVFWNVADLPKGNKPAKASTKGVVLVSGKSPAASAAFRDAMKGITPYEGMLEVLNSQRYSVIN